MDFGSRRARTSDELGVLLRESVSCLSHGDGFVYLHLVWRDECGQRVATSARETKRVELKMNRIFFKRRVADPGASCVFLTAPHTNYRVPCTYNYYPKSFSRSSKGARCLSSHPPRAAGFVTMEGLLADYGSSDSEEEEVEKRPAGAPSSDATTAPKPSTTGDRFASQGGAAASTSAAPRTALPSVASLLESTGVGVGSASMSLLETGGQGGDARGRGEGGGGGVKRPAGGAFARSHVPTKSSRGETRDNVSAKPKSSLVPPQLRGRSNNATQDLEALGFKAKPRVVKRS